MRELLQNVHQVLVMHEKRGNVMQAVDGERSSHVIFSPLQRKGDTRMFRVSSLPEKMQR